MNKYFNVAGPCIPGVHYMIPAFERLTEVIPLIEYGQYYVIHAARQSGKTTFLWDVTKKLNEEGKYYALYCSLESVQDVKDPKDGIPAVVDCIKTALQRSEIPNHEEFAKNANYSSFTSVLELELMKFCKVLDKPFVLFFDEADCLSEGTMIAFLRQLRSGYNSRMAAPFVHSIALVGMRNIRDFKAKVRPESETLGSASPFNIVTKTLTLTNLTKEQITGLYNQHTQETG
ncbi:MAG: ATP-binding protein, partial [Bacteroidales bacterium]|nr:ATP-binding protein [Bacteroidales bacterium]